MPVSVSITDIAIQPWCEKLTTLGLPERTFGSVDELKKATKLRKLVASGAKTMKGSTQHELTVWFDWVYFEHTRGCSRLEPHARK